MFHVLRRFTEFLNGEVNLVPVTCSYLIGTNIRQVFTNDTEEDSWWEKGITWCNLQDISGDFTVNLFNQSTLTELDEIPRFFTQKL